MSAAALGLDYGSKRIGIAVSDELGSIAIPLMTLQVRGRKQILAELVRLIDEYHIQKIVIGLPKTLKGEIGPSAQKVLEWVEWLKGSVEPECILWDERLTTREVERMLIDADVSRARRKEVRDKIAAQRILQSYLDHRA